MENGKRILVVDDDSDVLDQLFLELEKEGYEVVLTDGQIDAEAALSLMKPDLAIVDLMMENLDSGFVLYDRIQKIYPNTPIVVITSRTSVTARDFVDSDEQVESWNGANRLMYKPVKHELLKEEVASLLSA